MLNSKTNFVKKKIKRSKQVFPAITAELGGNLRNLIPTEKEKKNINY